MPAGASYRQVLAGREGADRLRVYGILGIREYGIEWK
jgi:hypothetical protein